MALPPINEAHALQIQAGISGRNRGHAFEQALADAINGFQYPIRVPDRIDTHLFTGDPALSLLKYIASRLGIMEIHRASAISTGALATSEEGKQWLVVNGLPISRCKSDLIVTLHLASGQATAIGVSTKQCNNKNPTNAQLYESPRVSWRLQFLRESSHEEIIEIFPRSPRTRCPHGTRTPR